jgi:hypothetical protein
MQIYSNESRWSEGWLPYKCFQLKNERGIFLLRRPTRRKLTDSLVAPTTGAHLWSRRRRSGRRLGSAGGRSRSAESASQKSGSTAATRGGRRRPQEAGSDGSRPTCHLVPRSVLTPVPPPGCDLFASSSGGVDAQRLEAPLFVVVRVAPSGVRGSNCVLPTAVPFSFGKNVFLRNRETNRPGNVIGCGT